MEKITISTVVQSDLETVWQAWNTPADIMQKKPLMLKMKTPLPRDPPVTTATLPATLNQGNSHRLLLLTQISYEHPETNDD